MIKNINTNYFFLSVGAGVALAAGAVDFTAGVEACGAGDAVAVEDFGFDDFDLVLVDEVVVALDSLAGAFESDVTAAFCGSCLVAVVVAF